MSAGSYIIYKATSPSRKVYIGLTKKSLEERKREHVSLANSLKGRFFHKALKKYEFNFKWEILESKLNLKEAESREKHYIELFNSTDKQCGYNLSPGGLAGSVMSKEGKERYKEQMNKHYSNPAYIKKMSESKKRSLAEDPNSSQKQRENILKYYSDPKNKEANKKHMQKIATSRSHREFMAKVKGGKPFMCNETQEIFYLLQDAADRFNTDKRNINKLLRNPSRYRTLKRKYTFRYI